MSLAISGDSPNFTNATLTTPTLTSPTFAGTPTGVGVLTSGTAVASTSGTSIDFTSIPSWVKRITVMFNNVSTSGTSFVQLQLGTGATPTYTTTGYVSTSFAYNSGTVSSSTTGILADQINSATAARYGQSVITLVSGNTWVMSGISSAGLNNPSVASGGITLAAALTAVRITTVNGTDTFDAGSINILYE